jgi:hypothetical protein
MLGRQTIPLLSEGELHLFADAAASEGELYAADADGGRGSGGGGSGGGGSSRAASSLLPR